MYPLLENINKFVEENGIVKSAIYINSKRLPKYLVSVASSELSKSGDACMLDDTCILAYDKNGMLSLILTFNDGSRRMVITDTKDTLAFPDKNFKYSKMRSETIYKKAKRLEFIDQVIASSYNELYEKYIRKYRNKIAESTTKADRDKAIKIYNYKNNEMKDMLRDEINFLIEEGHIKEYKTMVSSVDHELSLFEEAAKQYISYLNNEYLGKINEVITFDKQEDVKDKKNKVQVDSRKNSILPFEFRDEAINVLKPSMTLKAIQNDNDNIYYCYLVQNDNNEYKVLIEPFNGIKNTEVINIAYDGELDMEKFKDVALKYLTMNENSKLNSKAIIKLGHVNDENYLASVWYSVNRDNDLKINSSLKDKVNNIVPDEIDFNKTL